MESNSAMSLAAMTALIVGDEAISLAETLRVAKWREQISFLSETVAIAFVRGAAARHGVTVSAQEVQVAANAWRKARQLTSAEATLQWLTEHHLAVSEWEQSLADEVRERKLRQALFASEIDRYFAEHRLEFDAAELSQLVVSEEDVARELAVQIREEGADFHALARQFSEDADSRPAGGYLGRVRRSSLNAMEQATVFRTEQAEVLGPFRAEKQWRLLKVERLYPATLDDTVRAQIESTLFAAWLAEQRRVIPVETPLLLPAE